MRPEELRIGNLLYHKTYKEIIIVNGIHRWNGWKISFDKKILNSKDEFVNIPCFNDIYCFKLVPLTEEWLFELKLKNNLKYLSKHYYKFPGIEYKLGNELIYSSLNNSIYRYNVLLCSIEYVHQLQNLYFALIGKELIIKQ